MIIDVYQFFYAHGVSMLERHPHPLEIDISKIRFEYTPELCTEVDPETLKGYMETKLTEGFLVLGEPEFKAIDASTEAREWFRNQPEKSPWRFGNGGYIGFPGWLFVDDSQGSRKCNAYAGRIWTQDGWIGTTVRAKHRQTFPIWLNHFRIPLYPLNQSGKN